MSTQYRDPPQWKQNASRENEVKLFMRLESAAILCQHFIDAANMQFQIMQEHVNAGGDPLEAIVGSDHYEKIRKASEAEEAAKTKPEVAPKVEAPASPPADEPKKPKHKYVPRVNAAPFFVLAARAMDLQAELAPIVHELSEKLTAAGVNVSKLVHRDIIAQVIRDEFGIELEEIDEATYEEMREALRQTAALINECELGRLTDPPNGEATDG
jgi:leucyl aminopeptidase (aminopeptidase T)